jgi:copper chaperone
VTASGLKHPHPATESRVSPRASIVVPATTAGSFSLLAGAMSYSGNQLFAGQDWDVESHFSRDFFTMRFATCRHCDAVNRRPGRGKSRPNIRKTGSGILNRMVANRYHLCAVFDNRADLPDTGGETKMEYQIDAENIKCEGCASTIRSALGQIGGVHGVAVNIATGHVTVEADEGLRDAITAALNDSGYPEHQPR